MKGQGTVRMPLATSENPGSSRVGVGLETPNGRSAIFGQESMEPGYGNRRRAGGAEGSPA